jgi:hypothetical protein
MLYPSPQSLRFIGGYSYSTFQVMRSIPLSLLPAAKTSPPTPLQRRGAQSLSSYPRVPTPLSFGEGQGVRSIVGLQPFIPLNHINHSLSSDNVNHENHNLPRHVSTEIRRAFVETRRATSLRGCGDGETRNGFNLGSPTFQRRGWKHEPLQQSGDAPIYFWGAAWSKSESGYRVKYIGASPLGDSPPMYPRR